MATKNDITGDSITNSKGNNDKYRDNWERIFGGKDMKKHVQQITGETPHNVLDDLEMVSKEMDKRNVYTDYEEQYKILDEITRLDQEMGLYEACCWSCIKGNYFGMVLCKQCGNKRCPKATDHNFPCTNSNEPGQKGSIYE